MYEDDRIRSKNRAHSAAYEQFSMLRATGMSNADIVALCREDTNDKTRRDILDAMLRIAEVVSDGEKAKSI